MRRSRTADPLIPHFTPVPRVARVDGWTPDRQRAFIAALAATDSVSHAVSQSGMSKAGAYALRSAPGSAEFVAAWDAAVTNGVAALKSLAFDRAVNGIAVPVWHRGEQVGERRWYDNRLLGRLLTIYDRQPATRLATAQPAAAGSPPAAPAPAVTPPTKAARAAAELQAVIARQRHDRREQNLQWFTIAQLMRRWQAEPDGIATRIAIFERLAREDPAITAGELGEIAQQCNPGGTAPDRWIEPSTPNWGEEAE